MACLASTSRACQTRNGVSLGSYFATRGHSSTPQACPIRCKRLSQRKLFSCRQKSIGFRVNAMMDEGELVPDVDEGTKVRITKEVKVYHAPKIKELELKGMEGSVKSIVKKYKGKETSANLPYRIEFMLEKEDGKQQKFFAHVAASEFEKID